MKNFFSFLISKALWINVFIMFVLVSVGIYGVSVFLDQTTKHNDFVEVPEFDGFHFTEIEDYISDKNLRFEIFDSVFDASQPRGIVVEQIPLAGEMVKPGRKIYLTINSVTPPSVILPELRDFTVRQVVMKIETYGLKIDSLMYKPAECDNCVIGVLHEGKEVLAGARIEKGKSITLLVGEGIGSEKVPVPYLYRLTYKGARDYLNSLGLNVGFIEYDSTVITEDDSMKAFVFLQKPAYDSTAKVRQGQALDLMFTMDSNKLEGIELLVLDTNTVVEDE